MIQKWKHKSEMTGNMFVKQVETLKLKNLNTLTGLGADRV
jgi:hypothetical protein